MDSDVESFIDMVREVRRSFPFSDRATNPGFVEAAKLEAEYQPDTQVCQWKADAVKNICCSFKIYAAGETCCWEGCLHSLCDKRDWTGFIQSFSSNLHCWPSSFLDCGICVGSKWDGRRSEELLAPGNDCKIDGLIPFSNVQVKGRPEYLTCGRLADYEYIHQCYKYNFDVKLALIHR